MKGFVQTLAAVKRSRFFTIFSFLFFFSFSSPSFAGFSANHTDYLIDFGATLGTPSGLNLNFGVWGKKEIPYVIRATGMYYGQKLAGMQFELGYNFVRKENILQFVSIGPTITYIGGFERTFFKQMPLYTFVFPTYYWRGIGVYYGASFRGIFIQFGGSIGAINTPKKDAFNWFQPTVQLGYGYVLEWKDEKKPDVAL